MNARRRSLSGSLPPSVDLYDYFRIAPGKILHGFENLPCLPARLWSDGRFELLSSSWDVLGYREAELAGRRICELMELRPAAARVAMELLLTEGGSLEFGLRRQDGRETRYCWNRQFDDYTDSIFILGDELPASPGLANALHSAPVGRRERQPLLERA